MQILSYLLNLPPSLLITFVIKEEGNYKFVIFTNNYTPSCLLCLHDLVLSRLLFEPASDCRKINEPRWKRRIEGDIKKLRKEVNLSTRDLKGELGSKDKQKRIKNCD